MNLLGKTRLPPMECQLLNGFGMKPSIPGRVVVAVLLLVLPAAPKAQETTPSSGVSLPMPSIGLPLPQIGIPHPPMGLPPVQASPDRRPPDDRRPPPHGRRGKPAPGYPAVVYPFVWSLPSVIPDLDATTAKSPQPPPAGRVVVEVPSDKAAQVYIDGYYVGTPEDFPEGFELPAGPHALDVRSSGVEGVSTSVQVPAGRTITYRPVLATRPAQAPPASAPDRGGQERVATPPVTLSTEPSTFYVIPGCYLGNVPPEDVRLPASCDPVHAIVVRP